MRPGSWYPAGQWRDEATRAMDAHLARVADHHHPNPPATKLVRVEALTATWCVDGQPVEVGKVYTVAEHDVAVLELRGKGRRL